MPLITQYITAFFMKQQFSIPRVRIYNQFTIIYIAGQEKRPYTGAFFIFRA